MTFTPIDRQTHHTLLTWRDIEKIAKALGKHHKSGNGYMCLCPAHDDRNPSCSISNGKDGQLLIHCFAGCNAQDIFTALRKLGLLDNTYRPNTTLHTLKVNNPTNEPLDWSPKAENIWRMAIPIVGTPAELYLQNRGCFVPSCADLRFLPAWQAMHPAMLARVTDVLTNQPLTLHFTYLLPDGSDKASIKQPKLLLKGHRKTGGVVRLIDDEEVTMGLGITEGIENALTVMRFGWQPVWSAIDAGNVESFPVIPGIECLTIFADHDKAGLNAAQKCATRWLEVGRDARIVPPSNNGEDWNDVMVRSSL